MAGVEEFELTFVGEQFGFSISLSDHGLEFLHEMASTHFEVSSGKGAPLSLGSSFSGIQLLEMFREQLLPAKRETLRKGRGLLNGMGGPRGKAIRFYPSMPAGFMDSPEGKEYVVTISVPSQEGVKARIATLEAAFQDESADVEMVGELAARYSHAGRMLDAMRCLEAGIARLPADANLYGLLGETLMKLGRHAEALLQFKRVLEFEPNRAGAHCGLAICLTEMGDDDDALQHFLLAADLDPLSVGHQQNLGRALAAANRLVESAACWERAIEMDPSDSRGLIFLGGSVR